MKSIGKIINTYSAGLGTFVEFIMCQGREQEPCEGSWTHKKLPLTQNSSSQSSLLINEWRSERNTGCRMKGLGDEFYCPTSNKSNHSQLPVALSQEKVDSNLGVIGLLLEWNEIIIYMKVICIVPRIKSSINVTGKMWIISIHLCFKLMISIL